MLYNKLDETAEGVFIISATPFKESGALDTESTKKLIDFSFNLPLLGRPMVIKFFIYYLN